ncbi:MAG: UDP-N-acetylmuramoyl-L-alanine--D-glutamate ligase [Thermoleophilia bacterium]|jgi:UDP-N-acetylmuramoylalanine--D-glutamate ligase
MNMAADLRGIGRLLVIGMARSGIAAALAARRSLPEVEVVIADREEKPESAADVDTLAGAGVRVELGCEDYSLLDGCGLVVKSPGVPGDIPLIEEARQRGIPVWGEIEFAWRFITNFIIGVTGTNGKTTTTELITHILTSAGRPCRSAGNIGTALSVFVGNIDEDKLLVLELSSFQLEDTIDFRPDIAVLLNLSEDHLDRHDCTEDYYLSKMNIFVNQQPHDLAIINLDDPACHRPVPVHVGKVWFSGSAGDSRPAVGERMEPLVFVRDGVIRANLKGLATAGSGVRTRLPQVHSDDEAGRGPDNQHGVDAPSAHIAAGGRNELKNGEDSTQAGSTAIIAWKDASLKGDHNLENCLAATSVCLSMGLSPGEVAGGLVSFPGVPHRLQQVRIVDGVTYVNDSKATNVDAAIKALTAFEGGVHLILGGSLKGCTFDRLAADAPEEKITQLIAIGEAAQEIATSFDQVGRETIMAAGLEEAIDIASASAGPGDVVLLAPACASFDQYDNYEQRGEHFISLVNML